MHTKILQTINLMILFTTLQINKCPQSDTKSPLWRFFAAFVYEVPSWQSVPRLKRIKTEFDAYLNSANNNFNDVI